MTQGSNGSIRVHLGCGLITPADWVNVDGSWNARLAKHPLLRRALHVFRLTESDKIKIPWNPDVVIHDLRKPLPFRNNSASAIYSSHALEHMYRTDGQKLIRECFRVLKDDGVLRIVVPDLRAIVREYLGESPSREPSNGSKSMRPGDRMNERLLMRSQAPPSGNIFYRLYSSWKDFHSHKWMYDADSLAHHLEVAGFVDVKEMELHRSRITGIEKLEDPSRVLNGEGICVEGAKPRTDHS